MGIPVEGSAITVVIFDIIIGDIVVVVIANIRSKGEVREGREGTERKAGRRTEREGCPVFPVG